MEQDLLSTKEAARFIGMGWSTVQRWASEGKLPSVLVDGRYKLPRIALEEWCQKQPLTKRQREELMKAITIAGGMRLPPQGRPFVRRKIAVEA